MGVAMELDKVLDRSELDSKSADAIDGLLGKVATFRNDLLKKLISTFLKSVKNAYKAASGVSEEDRNKMKNELDEISSQVRSDVMKALAETTSNGHTVMLNNRLMKMSANSRDTYGQIMGSRLEKVSFFFRFIVAPFNGSFL
ncbi:unnamed protein product [Anisakis simplex]|uniref:Uncharacterized protein n=1 Tax=Anisakis simplex TaxID=6269 RepID=A0A3P6P1K6_ANISI|nr:unnamed protein product [Anisakis simplex]